LKFNPYRISHYFAFGLTFFSFVCAFLYFLISWKTKSNQVILYGHKLIGNLEALFINQHFFHTECYYLTLNLSHYLFLKKMYKNNQFNKKILFAIFPHHLLILLRSRVVAVSHGIFYHKLLKKLKIKSIFIGHALDGVYPVNPKYLENLELYDQVWMFSKYEYRLYKDNFKYKKNNLTINGYPKVHQLLKTNVANIFDNKKVLLFAPTASRENKVYEKSELTFYNFNFIEQFENYLENKNLILILQPHINDKVPPKVIKLIKKSQKIFLFSELKFNRTELLSLADVLITDYSTIYVEYLPLQKPIYFLKPPDPNPNWKYTGVIENKLICRLDSLETLFNKLDKKQESSELLYSNLKNLFYEGINIDEILERSFININKLMPIVK